VGAAAGGAAAEVADAEAAAGSEVSARGPGRGPGRPGAGADRDGASVASVAPVAEAAAGAAGESGASGATDGARGAEGRGPGTAPGTRGAVWVSEGSGVGGLAGAPLPVEPVEAPLPPGLAPPGRRPRPLPFPPPAMESRNLRATGASTVEDADFTYSPRDSNCVSTCLLVTPSSFASSCTRALPATDLLILEVGGVPATSCPTPARSS